MKRLNREFYRLPREGKIAGVCAGIAEHFGIETWLVRIIFVSGMLLSGAIFFVAYIAAWFILDSKPGYEKKESKQKHWGAGFQGESNVHVQSGFDERPIEVKEKVWQAGEPPRQAFHDITSRFKGLEKRLQNLETYVTSTEFTVSREINRL